MLWETLVTDGHVRAARFRILAIPLVIVGVVFILMAQPIAGLIFRQPGGPLNLYRNFQGQAAAPVVAKFAQMHPISLSEADAKKLAPTNELTQVTELILKSLQTTDAPPNNLPLKNVTADVFWSSSWSPTEIFHLQKDDIQAFGAIVTTSPDQPTPYTAVRWLSIFRKQDGTWHNVSIAYGDFFNPAGSAVASPERIPVTLRSIMNIEAFKP